MSHKEIIDYLENINTQLVDFGENSFFRMDLQEITGSFRTGITFPCMLVESPDGDLDDSNINSSAIGKNFAFLVLKNPTSNNYEQQNQYLDDCEKIGLKIIARMRYDARVEGNILFNKFQANTVNFIKVGPLFTEQLHGYRFVGKILGDQNLKIVPEDWADLSSDCP